MSFRKYIAVPIAAALLASALMLNGAGASSTDTELFAKMENARSEALSYEETKNYAFAYKYMSEYAEAAETLSSTGDVCKAEAERAAAHRDILYYDPQIYFQDKSKSADIAVGSDGYYSENANAVKLCVPYGMANVEDFSHIIPKTDKMLTVLVTMDISHESTMLQIANGKDEAALTENIRQLSLIKGEVYLAFCPGVNAMHQTRTLVNNYISAYRVVAEHVRRYAPHVKLVYAVGDVTIPDQNTLSVFYPGDEYVDVLGIELCHTYNPTGVISSKAAYDRRGSYYDPVYSVKHIADEFARLCGREDIPTVITGCSFPWEGYAAVEDYLYEMERFYRLMPLVCPNITAIFYSNVSSANGFCNLRQNRDAMEMYEKCLTLPQYSESGFSGIGESVAEGTRGWLEVYCGGIYSDEFAVYQNGEQVSSTNVSLTTGRLTVYMTDPAYNAKIELELALNSSGDLIPSMVPQTHDINKNGYLDLGDVALILGYIAKIDMGVDASELDINGDGSVNISDVVILRAELKP